MWISHRAHLPVTQLEDLQPGDLLTYQGKVVLVLDIILDDHDPERSIISALWPDGVVKYAFWGGADEAYHARDQP